MHATLPMAAQPPSITAPRVLAIWTRDQNASAATGRGKITAEVRSVIDHGFTSQHLRLRHLLSPERGQDVVAGLAETARSLPQRRPLPMQCQIFAPRSQAGRILQVIATFRPDVVYLDSIRAAPLAAPIRHTFPGLRIVLDMDDLMSRRWAFLKRIGIFPGFGFLERYLPQQLTGSTAAQAAIERFLRGEARRLLALELEAARHVDDIVLVSPHEARLLGRLMRRSGGRRALAQAIRPPVEIVTNPPWRLSDRPRFVFIGTDDLPQNRLTIEAIIALWARLRPDATVHLYGNIKGNYPAVRNVVLEGFAPDLLSVYAPGSVLLAPSYVKGGIKTKVLEAFSHGCPVLGNRATFEGIGPLEGYPLLLDEGDMAEVVRAPEIRQTQFLRASRLGRELVTRHYDRALFRRGWHDLLADRVEAATAA